MAIIQSGVSADQLTIDSTSKAARTTLYDTSGNSIIKIDKTSLGITPGATAGIPLLGADYKTPVLIRATSDGTLLDGGGNITLMLYDRAEGAAVDTNKWVQTTTTMTIAQAAGVITFNANNTTTTTTGAMHTSHKFFPFVNRTALIAKFRARHTAHFAGSIIEQGFASPASATSASLVNGAVWRKDSTGQYLPVLSIAGNEILGTPISNATFLASVPATDYAIFEIVLQNNRGIFSIYKTTGEVVTTQNLDITTASTSFQQTHLQAMVRTYNASGVSTAVQVLLDDVSCWMLDHTPGKSWREIMSGMNYNSFTSPTAYTQNANYANSAAPASATLSNTAAGYTTLGGQFQYTNVAPAETDYALFAFTVPSPYTFFITAIRIDQWLQSAGTAPASVCISQWGLGLNSSAVSLATGAPYPPMKITLGAQSLIASATAGTMFNQPIMWNPATPYVVQPGRFIHIILKIPAGAAGTTAVMRGQCMIDGWFE